MTDEIAPPVKRGRGQRISPERDAECRAKIQTSQILNRLNKLAVGEIDATPAQMKAAEILLRKTLPDLSSVELTGKDGGPMLISWERV